MTHNREVPVFVSFVCFCARVLGGPRLFPSQTFLCLVRAIRGIGVHPPARRRIGEGGWLIILPG